MRWLLLLALTNPAFGAGDPVGALQAHQGCINARFVLEQPVPSSWRVVLEADPIRGRAWQAWIAHHSEAKTIGAAMDREERDRPSTLDGDDIVAMGPVYLDSALHCAWRIDERMEYARFAGQLIQDVSLLETAWRVADPPIRVGFIAGLVRRPATIARPLLLMAVEDSEVPVREAAISVISRRVDAPAFAEVLARASRDEARSVRTLAVRAIGWHRLMAQWDQVETLLDDESAAVRVKAWHALYRLDGPRAVALARTRPRDRDGEVADVVDRLEGGRGSGRK